MTTTAIRELQEKRLELANEIKALADVDATGWSDEQEARWSELNESYDGVNGDLEKALQSEDARKERLQQKLKIDEELSRSTRTQLMQNAPIALAGGDGESVLRQREQRADLCLKAWIRAKNRLAPTDKQKIACAEAQFDFRDDNSGYMLPVEDIFRGMEAWTSGASWCRDRFEKRVLDTTTATAGPETIPEGFVRELEQAMLAFGGVRRVARIFRTADSNPWQWPTINDTGNAAAILAENNPVVMADAVTGQVTFNAYKFASATQVTAELLDDNAVNLGSVLGQQMGERIGRGTAAYFANGTGTGQPEGITQCAEGKVAASATAVTSDEMIDLIHSVDPSYRMMSSVGFVMHDSTVAALRKLKTTDGAYHWQPGMQAGVPDRLFGYPYVVDNDMPQISDGVNSRIVVFGAMEKFVIRDHAALRFYRLEELYRANDLTGFMIFSRHDSRILDAGTNPLKYLAMAAT